MKTRLWIRTLAISSIAIGTMSVPQKGFSAWIAAGGDLIGDEFNPWYIQNTKTVKACIVADSNSFPAHSKLVETVQTAWNFWVEDFKYSKSIGHMYFDIKNRKFFSADFTVATQTLQITDCGSDTDLKIQFGTLDEKQSLFLNTGVFSLAKTVRTYYDNANLRARGFLYIAPQVGEQMKKLNNDNSKRFLSHFLIHEFGHIFGLKHFDGADINLMSSDYLSGFYRDMVYSLKSDSEPIVKEPRAFFNYHDTVEILSNPNTCISNSDDSGIKGILDPMNLAKCIELPKFKSGKDKFTIMGRLDDNSKIKLGEISLQDKISIDEFEAINLRVTSNATDVFPGLSDFLKTKDTALLQGNIFVKTGWKGQYSSSSSNSSIPMIIIPNRNNSISLIGNFKDDPISTFEKYRARETKHKKTNK